MLMYVFSETEPPRADCAAICFYFGLNSEFSFFKSGCQIKAKDPKILVQPTIYT